MDIVALLEEVESGVVDTDVGLYAAENYRLNPRVQLIAHVTDAHREAQFLHHREVVLPERQLGHRVPEAFGVLLRGDDLHIE